jgi:hypothetical protein
MAEYQAAESVFCEFWLAPDSDASEQIRNCPASNRRENTEFPCLMVLTTVLSYVNH